MSGRSLHSRPAEATEVRFYYLGSGEVVLFVFSEEERAERLWAIGEEYETLKSVRTILKSIPRPKVGSVRVFRSPVNGLMGTMLDRALMSLPAVRSFRNRYLAARDQLVNFLVERSSSSHPVHIVSVPCGRPRELSEAARIAVERAPGCLDHVYFHGIDLDKKVLRDAVDFAATEGPPTFFAHHGDALDAKSYPGTVDFITCTGLAEFLDDAQLAKLYGIFRKVLKPGGKLFTSGMRR